MTKPIVTDEMYQEMLETLKYGGNMRAALGAALAVQPKPEQVKLTEEERSAVERLRALGTITHRVAVAALDRLTGNETK